MWTTVQYILAFYRSFNYPLNPLRLSHTTNFLCTVFTIKANCLRQYYVSDLHVKQAITVPKFSSQAKRWVLGPKFRPRLRLGLKLRPRIQLLALDYPDNQPADYLLKSPMCLRHTLGSTLAFQKPSGKPYMQLAICAFLHSIQGDSIPSPSHFVLRT